MAKQVYTSSAYSVRSAVSSCQAAGVGIKPAQPLPSISFQGAQKTALGVFLSPLFSYRKATKIQRDADDKHTWLSGNNLCPLSSAGTNFSSFTLFSLPSQAQLLCSYISTPLKPMKVFEIPPWGNSTGRISDAEREADFHYVRQITYSLCFP